MARRLEDDCMRVLSALGLTILLLGCGGGSGNIGADQGGDASSGAGGSETTSADDGPKTAPLGNGAWDARLDVTFSGSYQDCADFSFTLDVVDEGDSLTLLFGREGKVRSIAVKRESASKGVATDAVAYVVPNNECHTEDENVTLGDFAITAMDNDGDGTADRLSSTGTGRITVADGKIGQLTGGTYDMQYKLEAQLDRTSPSFGPVADHHPLEPLVVLASEPLKSAALMLDGPPAVALEGQSYKLPPASFQTKQILPFSGRWHLAGSAEDFAGHLADLSVSLTTLEDPGVFLQDGFEGPLPAGNTYAKIIDDTSGLTPPSGKHALLLESGSGVTLHLTRALSQRTLSVTVVGLASSGIMSSSVLHGVMQAGVIGGIKVVPFEWGPGPLTDATGNSQFPQATAPVRAQAILDEVGTDVAVQFQAANCVRGGPASGAPCYDWPGLLLDDLQFE
jgi:hypothetical protein